jgi:DNA-binding CsgD family transcriptional regulator
MRGSSESAWRAGHLVGRVSEVERLRTFWLESRNSGQCLVVAGEQGVGKSTLLAAAAHAVAASGGRVLAASGVQAESGIGFAGLNQLLMPVHHEIERLGDRHRQALEVALGLARGDPSPRVTTVRATQDLFARLSQATPLLVMLDDVHFFDGSTSGVLGDVARHLSGMCVGLLAALRPGEDRSFDAGPLPRLTLEPLSATSAELLLDQHAPGLLPRERRQVLRQAQGNPLVLTELSSTLVAQHSGNAPQIRQPSLSPRLRAVFGPQVRSLPVATRQLLLIAALDRSGNVRAALASQTATISGEDLRPAEQAGLVRGWTSADKQVTFTHPLVQTTVVELADDVELREAHLALADSEASTVGGDLGRRAWHLAHAAIEPKEDVAALIEQGARSMLRDGDAAGAVDMLLRAADLSPPGADRSRRLSEAAYTAANVTGDLRGVIPLLADARNDDPVGSRTLEAATAAAYVLMQGEGDVHTAHRLLVGAIEAHQSRAEGESAALNEALFSLLSVCIYGGTEDLWPPFYSALARSTAELPLSLSLWVRTLADPARASVDDVRRVRSAIALAEQDRDYVEIWRVASSALYVDQLEHACIGLWRVVDDGRAGGAVTMAINSLNLLQFDALFSGRWDDAQQMAREALELCDKHGYRLVTWPARYGQALVAAARGDYEMSGRLIADSTKWAEPRRIRTTLGYASHVRTMEALGRGNFEDAFRHASMISEPGVLASHVPVALRVLLDLVEAAVRTGRLAEAQAHVDAIRETDVASLSSRLALLVGAATALVAPAADADGLFAATLSAPDADRWPFDLARVHLLYGEHLRRIRAVSRAREPLEAALESFEFLGARPWADRARSELLATGLHRDPDHLLAGLTSREQEVASMAAAGLTNRQVAQRLGMSPRTVGAHLYRVYAKLGVSSRAGLRDALPGGEQ